EILHPDRSAANANTRLGSKVDSLIGMLQELRSREFIYLKQGSKPRYAFKHTLTQEVAYSSLLSERRALLHASAGDAIEELFAGQLGGSLPGAGTSLSCRGSNRPSGQVPSPGRASGRGAVRLRGIHRPPEIGSRTGQAIARGRRASNSGVSPRSSAVTWPTIACYRPRIDKFLDHKIQLLTDRMTKVRS